VDKILSATMAGIFGGLAGVCLIIAIVCLVMCQKGDKSALDRNNDSENALI